MLAFMLAQGPAAVPPELAARVQINEAVTLARSGRLTEALRAIDASILSDPFFAAAHHNRGIVLAMLGRDRDALAALDRAIRLDPANRAARGARAAILRRLRMRPARSPSARG